MEVSGVDEPFDLGDPADVGALRRRVVSLAGAAGHDAVRVGEAALVATEAATNVLKHAGHGGALVAPIADGDARGVRLIVWDRGPGMNVDACLRDGMSTAGTAGQGLGAIARLATRWRARSTPGGGTVIVATLLGAARAPAAGAVDVGAVRVAYPGEDHCGDAWAVDLRDGVVTAIVTDGLGHGRAAEEAAEAILRAFHASAAQPLTTIIERCDGAARGTRGGAATVVRVDPREATLRAVGVGNVGVWLWTEPAPRPLVVQHGTLGLALPRLREERVACPAGAAVVLASDGIRARWSLGTEHDGLRFAPAAVIAAVLWRDFQRGRDDATALALRVGVA